MIPDFFNALFGFFVILTPLVFFHELGHYLAARSIGVGVEEFSIGFGPGLFSWKDRHGTRWKIGPFLAGGYVKMAGDADIASTASVTKTREDMGNTLGEKTPGQRIFVAAAGPFANYLIAFLLFLGLFLFKGKPVMPLVMGPGETTLVANPFQQKDRMIALELPGGEPEIKTGTLQELHVALKTLESKGLDQGVFHVEREGKRLSITIKKGDYASLLTLPWDKKARFYQPISLGETLSAIGKIFNPVSMLGSFKLSKMGGPLAIAHQSGSVIQQSWVEILFFAGSISLALGFFNLLPLPVLDGGMILLSLVEIVRRKPLSEKIKTICTNISFFFLLSLFVVLFWKDLGNIRPIKHFLEQRGWIDTPSLLKDLNTTA